MSFNCLKTKLLERNQSTTMKATLVIAFALFVAVSAAPKTDDKLATLMASKGIDRQQIIDAAHKMMKNFDSVKGDKRSSILEKFAARGFDVSELLKAKAVKEGMSKDEAESHFAQKVEEKLAKLKSRMPEKYNKMF